MARTRDAVDHVMKVFFVAVGADPDGHQAVLEGLVPLFGLVAKVSVGVARDVVYDCRPNVGVHARLTDRPRLGQVALIALGNEARQKPRVVGHKLACVEGHQPVEQLLRQSRRRGHQPVVEVEPHIAGAPLPAGAALPFGSAFPIRDRHVVVKASFRPPFAVGLHVEGEHRHVEALQPPALPSASGRWAETTTT